MLVPGRVVGGRGLETRANQEGGDAVVVKYKDCKYQKARESHG